MSRDQQPADRTKNGPTPKRAAQRAARKRGLPPMPPLLTGRPLHGDKPGTRAGA